MKGINIIDLKSWLETESNVKEMVFVKLKELNEGKIGKPRFSKHYR